ncbi:MAG: glycosyltransferase [Candidatus Dormibacteraeota bacterium]|nr:glycosyltransferase [Candidatus Dormibacteraeota bacterium]
MRVLLSTIGSRGDVQPLVALALQLTELGQEVRICAPPDFRDWIDTFGIPFVPIGPEVRSTAKSSPAVVRAKPSPEQMRQIAQATVATQFEVLPAAAEGCDVLLGGGALQIALRSVAEQKGIRYVYASYCPISLPSSHHPPPTWRGDSLADGTADNGKLWDEDAQRWNDSWGVALNSHRRAAGQAPVADVRSHIFSDRPWLAADPSVAPWPEPLDDRVIQTGAWIMPDARPLPAELEAFLEAGEPPVYLGFGSIRPPQDLSQNMIKAARMLGRRAIVSRGWADLPLLDNEPDCLSIGEVNQQALFKRVAAAVHHGGAGTTTAAARAGAPQLIIPQHYDQHYWAQRIDQLGIGSAHPPVVPSADSLVGALSHALQPDTVARAQLFARAVRTDGAKAAAQRLTAAGEAGDFRTV